MAVLPQADCNGQKLRLRAKFFVCFLQNIACFPVSCGCSAVPVCARSLAAMQRSDVKQQEDYSEAMWQEVISSQDAATVPAVQLQQLQEQPPPQLSLKVAQGQ